MSNNATKERPLVLTDVTLLMPGEFGGHVVATHCRELHLWRAKYAQYPSAIHLRFKKPRQRNWRGTTAYGDKRVVIVKGKRTDLGQDMFGPEEAGSVPGVMVRKSRHTMFSPEWAIEWAAQLDASDAEVLFDESGSSSAS